LNKILRRRPQSTHCKEIPGGGRPFITIAMLLDPAFGIAMVVFLFEIGFLMSTIPTQRIYEGYLCLRVFLLGVRVLEHS